MLACEVHPSRSHLECDEQAALDTFKDGMKGSVQHRRSSAPMSGWMQALQGERAGEGACQHPIHVGGTGGSHHAAEPGGSHVDATSLKLT